MSQAVTTRPTIDILIAARRIADHAKDEGALWGQAAPRATCEHLGAVLADSVLQAGLNYSTVVRPRVLAILRTYPKLDTVSTLLGLIHERKTGEFLNWRHHEKVTRFEALLALLKEWGIENVQDLRTNLAAEHFCDAIQTINGVGPKTVDYMACLVGIDSIAVDRHVRSFAKRAGVENNDYLFLRKSFCCAADLLTIQRREFDAWLWRRAAFSTETQLGLGI
jgi:hypothetical protein